MTCRLCLQARPLCKSHLLPDFVFEALYDDKHRFYQVAKRSNRLRQSGVWERLLCTECEGRFSYYERYAKTVLQGGAGVEYARHSNIVEVSGLDYHLFRMFQLSILWRASASENPFFDEVELGRHEDILRQLLLNDDPGDFRRYSCLLYGLKSDEHAFHTVMQPTAKRLPDTGHRIYRFVFGAFLWIYVVDTRPLPKPLVPVTLQPSGTLAFTVNNVRELDDMQNARARSANAKR